MRALPSSCYPARCAATFLPKCTFNFKVCAFCSMLVACVSYLRELGRTRSTICFGLPVVQTCPELECAPTQSAAVIRPHPNTGERRLDTLKWGLISHFTTDLTHLMHGMAGTRRRMLA